jgi:L-arginine dehydrogenase
MLNCPTLSAAEIAARISAINIQEALRRAFRSLAEGRAAQPPQTLALFPGGGGDFITYLGVLADEGVFGAKLSPYLARPQGGIVTAWTLLMSMESGEPLLLCDSKQLTTERTAATTALAVDFLAPEKATKLAVIGSGPVAQAHLRHVARLRSWTQIRVYSPKLAGAPERAKAVAALDPRVQIAPGLEEATRGADAILLCTSAGTPVLDPNGLTSPALVTSISTNLARAHEVPPASLRDMDVYCDFRLTTPLAAGEMQIAAAEHGWSAAAIAGDLPELASRRARLPDHSRSVFFRSVGLGIEDIAVANAVRKSLTS